MSSEQIGNTEKLLSVQTDAQLYLALKAGQTAALGILYDRHAGLVYGIALKVLENPQEAEDLTQDIFLNFVKIGSYEPSRGSLRTYLAILTRSRSVDRVRSRSNTRELLKKWGHSREETATDSLLEKVSRSEQSQEVKAALAQLSDEQQQILRMAYYDGLSQSEIANQLEIPLGTVKARARRGLLKLRQALTDYMK